MFTMLGVEIEYLGIEQGGKGNNCRLPTRRTLINECFTVCNGLGIGSATRVGALSTLSLRQQCVDLIDNRIAFDLEAYRRVAEYQAEYSSHQADGKNCDKHRLDLDQAAEPHEGQRHQPRGNQADRRTLEWRWHIGNIDAFAHGREQD